MNAIRKILPSTPMRGDSISVDYLATERVRPILLHELKLIRPMKRKLLELRPAAPRIRRGHEPIAIIVPFRHRDEHLAAFVPAMHAYLTEAGIPFEILVVEQMDSLPFNRAKLLNCGTRHVGQDVTTYVFHDVDMLPQTIDYRSADQPLRLVSHLAEDGEDYTRCKETYFGGVVMVPRPLFESVNGFSNEFWHWGLEDDDFLLRFLLRGYAPFLDTEGRCLALPHHESIWQEADGSFTTAPPAREKLSRQHERNRRRFSAFKRGLKSQDVDGLSTLDYELVSVEERAGYRLVQVSFDGDEA